MATAVEVAKRDFGNKTISEFQLTETKNNYTVAENNYFQTLIAIYRQLSTLLQAYVPLAPTEKSTEERQ